MKEKEGGMREDWTKKMIARSEGERRRNERRLDKELKKKIARSEGERRRNERRMDKEDDCKE